MKSKRSVKLTSLYRWGGKGHLSAEEKAKHKISLVLNRINRDGPVIYDRLGKCWIYKGVINHAGYGVLMTSRQVSQDLVHRLVYESVHGPIPDGICVLHKCDNPSCCRPDHLFLGTHRDNMQDMARKGRSAKAKLTETQVRTIRDRYANGDVSLDQLGKEFGVHLSTISLAVRRVNWKHVT